MKCLEQTRTNKLRLLIFSFLLPKQHSELFKLPFGKNCSPSLGDKLFDLQNVTEKPLGLCVYVDALSCVTLTDPCGLLSRLKLLNDR